MGIGMLLEDFQVGVVELLATKCTDGFGLGCFHGSSVGVDFGTGSSCVGLLLLAMDAVFLGDGHLFFWL